MKILVGIFLLLLTACGFQPLYETGGSSTVMQEQLAAIEVGAIPDRLGQVMRNRLVSRLNAAGNPDYTLDVSLVQSSETFGIRPDTAATQEQLTLVANMQLISLKTGEPVLQDSLRARTSFDLVLSDYASVTQREDAATRLVLELAERIHRRLALHFANQDDSPKNSQSATPTP